MRDNFKNVSIDNIEIIEKKIPTKFIKFLDYEVDLNKFLSTIEQVLECSKSFPLKDYDVISEDTIKLLKKMDYVVEQYGEFQSIIYTVKDDDKKTQLSDLYDKICSIIE